MREIKFRAWDKKENRWFERTLKWVGFHLFGECTLIDTPPMSKLIDLEITQYTGLKDKSGREIYEGDIVKNGINVLFKIEWSTLYCGFVQMKCDEFDVMAPMNYNSKEIIGNIYENKELLNA